MESFDITVINRTKSYLLVQCSNGDTEVMSNEEYEKCMENRIANGFTGKR